MKIGPTESFTSKENTAAASASKVNWNARTVASSIAQSLPSKETALKIAGACVALGTSLAVGYYVSQTAGFSFPSFGNATNNNTDANTTPDVHSTDVNAAGNTKPDVDATDLNASNINATDLNASNINASNINATDVNATDVNATDINATDINTTTFNASNINASNINASDVNATDVNATATRTWEDLKNEAFEYLSYGKDKVANANIYYFDISVGSALSKAASAVQSDPVTSGLFAAVPIAKMVLPKRLGAITAFAALILGVCNIAYQQSQAR